MKNTLRLVTFCILFSTSCTKSGTPNDSGTISIDKITGTYKGGTLQWEKWQKNPLTNNSSGTDPNVSFTATYSTNRVKVDIVTTAPISIKSFDLPLTNKYEMQTAAQIASALYKFQDSSITTTLEKTFLFSSSMLKTALNIDISGSLEFSYLTNPWSTYPTFEKFYLSGTKQ